MASTDIDKQTYLDALRDCGIKTAACKRASVSYGTVQRWLKDDVEFGLAYEDALEEASDLLEVEARRRAVDGVERTKYKKDGEAYVETTYSDTLLIFLLNGAKPNKYAYRTKTELSGADGKPIEVNETSAAARIAALLDAARTRRTDIDPLS